MSENHDDSTAVRVVDASQPEQDDLSDALAGLSQVAIGAQPLETSLARIAALAVQAIPGADGAGLTMLEAGHRETIAASAPFVRAVDDVQYGIGEGPCITAAAEGRTVLSGHLGDDTRWPRFGPEVQAMEVHSVVSLPLALEQEVIGALNVYAHDRDVFTDQAAALGEVFAVTAAVAVHNARVLMQAQRLAGQLQTALTSRAVIDQAIGILCARQGCTPEEGFSRLRTISQTENRKVAVVAQVMVDEAIRRARARRAKQ